MVAAIIKTVSTQSLRMKTDSREHKLSNHLLLTKKKYNEVVLTNYARLCFTGSTSVTYPKHCVNFKFIVSANCTEPVT